MNIEGAAALARAWLTAIQYSRHYGPDHRATAGSIEELFITMRREMRTLGALRIEADPHWLRIDTAALPVEDQHAGPLAAHLGVRRIQALTLRPEVTLNELATMIRLLAVEPEELIAEGGLVESLQKAGVRAISVTESGDASTPIRAARGDDPTLIAASALDQLMTDVAKAQPADLARARQAIEDLARAFSRTPLPIWHAVAARSHDELDPIHGVATAVLTMAAAEAMEVLERPRIDLGIAALLHDIGLAMLPPPTRGRERTVEGAQDSWRHPAEGGYLLRDAEHGGNLAMVVAIEHHLPALNRSDVLPQSQLVSLADYVDAMTAGRVPAVRRLTLDGVMDRLIAGEGPKFDPVHVRVLAAVLHDAAVAGADFWS
ncbi:MAG: HD domain-containing protein [Armatimonadetes bacterium]|nr:HD domain-containing protein [Armatimonadota bacterium]